MNSEAGKVRLIAAGILGAKEEGGLHCVELAEAMLSNRVVNTGLSDKGWQMLAWHMISEGFGNDARKFVLAFRQYYEKLQADQELPTTKQHEVLDQLLIGSLHTLRSDLNSGRALDDTTITAAVTIRRLINGLHDGKATQLIRYCGEKIDAEIIDQYCQDHPYAFNEWDCFADKVREWLLEGLFRRLGFWRIWLLVRRFFLGKKPEEAETEAERQLEIAIIQASLDGSWMHPVDLNNPNMDMLQRKEYALLERLRKIDPDNTDSWFKSHAPADRLTD